MHPIKGTITDPAVAQFLTNRDPGDETDEFRNDRILLDRDEYNRRLAVAYEEGYLAAMQEARKRLRTVAQKLIATVDNL